MNEAVWAGWRFETMQPRDVRFFREAGLYAYVHRDARNGAVLLFAGQAADLAAEAGPTNGLWVEALRLGFNEVHLRFPVRRRVDRLSMLGQIVRRVQPVLNVIDQAYPAPDAAMAPPRLRA